MQIEIDVFSGRENPGWEPAPGEAAALEKKLRREAPVDNAVEPDVLGYKGFVITIRQKDNTAVEKIRVFNGIIYYYSHPRQCFKDTAQLEPALLQQARLHGFAQLLQDLQL